jgi:hypothetical protein
MRESLHQITRRIGRQVRDDHHGRGEMRGQCAEQHIQHFDPTRRAADHHEIVGASRVHARLGFGR